MLESLRDGQRQSVSSGAKIRAGELLYVVEDGGKNGDEWQLSHLMLRNYVVE
jgi:hypothetical protein